VLEDDPDMGVRVTVLVLVIGNDPDREARPVVSTLVIGNDPDREARPVVAALVIGNDPDREGAVDRLGACDRRRPQLPMFAIAWRLVAGR
jgi:hypothetical protein